MIVDLEYGSGTDPNPLTHLKFFVNGQELGGDKTKSLELLADLVKSHSWVGNPGQEELLSRILLRLCARYFYLSKLVLHWN
jgi:hypothetical protein